ncbi:hypothetical protein PSDVSF_00190 [Pseudodesulfovibrio sediminis]|uniref:Uncharacterized protein n=1 Tax=Pseudodesulfovibrio sediminis TaxID=2810563 RepID=A0ABN6EL79_9BACT|nr:hypothetical protein PSDVSF_00190 [Pseudodesulfovibrio sediminis]
MKNSPLDMLLVSNGEFFSDGDKLPQGQRVYRSETASRDRAEQVVSYACLTVLLGQVSLM